MSYLAEIGVQPAGLLM